MKLLFDQNLSPRLATLVADEFPDSSHVHWLGLDAVDDWEVWCFARDNDFVIVTKDADYGELGTMHGFPPKVIWLRVGNCTTGRVLELLQMHYSLIRRLGAEDDTIGILSLF